MHCSRNGNYCGAVRSRAENLAEQKGGKINENSGEQWTGNGEKIRRQGGQPGVLAYDSAYIGTGGETVIT